VSDGREGGSDGREGGIEGGREGGMDNYLPVIKLEVPVS
jgi:hypothetical protein